ncbi:hypothetical protein ACQYWQ_18845 [Streptomyces sp. P6-2-1]|uniref:hypothetical protein n=1 Tax=Streptomyces sp. P6-2-1 TaxID=3422591 RepID=UPI003D36AC49
MRDDQGVGGGSGRPGAGEGDPARIALDWRQSAALVDTVPGADTAEEWIVTARAGHETMGAMTVYRLRLDAPSGRSPALDLEDWDADHARGPWATRAPGERQGLSGAGWEEAGFVPMKGGWVLDVRGAWSG